MSDVKCNGLFLQWLKEINSGKIQGVKNFKRLTGFKVDIMQMEWKEIIQTS